MNTLTDKSIDLFDYQNNFERYKAISSKLICGNQNSRTVPSITICVPVYKPNIVFFKKTLQSLKVQDCSCDYEILIVNNEKVDRSKDLVYQTIIESNIKNFLYYVNDDNIGMVGNWNRCIELARSNLITFCHADDELKSDCLSRLLKLHSEFPNYMISSAFDVIDENDNFIVKYKYNCGGRFFYKHSINRLDLFDLFHGGIGFGVGCLFEKDKLIKIGGFCPDYYPSADYALFIKYCYQYGLLQNEIPTFNYRKAENDSFNQWKNFLVMDAFFRKCMSSKIRLPNCFLSFYSTALYKFQRESFAKSWTKEGDSVTVEKCDFLSWLFVKIVLKISHLKKYKFRLRVKNEK